MRFHRAPQHKFNALPKIRHKLTPKAEPADSITAMTAKFYFYFFSDLTPLADGEGQL
ncbi:MULTISPECIES: hypothetical protein [unclassified Cupriavidus]|uniref:hypothetical protein n=1 Tax=unclassified Cupriavidus TaxID=2640874 RepID=UPI00088A79F1|nr:hypothetical protein [Cupriavidus sp. YR651]SDD24476.1 hypothetical protein SAMN05216345_107119 [Cupriavidus sp. YR651]